MMKFSKTLLAAILFSVLSLTAMTQAFAEEHPAQKMVVDSVTAMLEVFKNDKEKIKSDPEFLQSKIDQYVIPDLDFDTMTKLAVGKFWRRADENQHKELVKEFETLLLNTYTAALVQYSDGEATVDFEPFRPDDREDRAVVRSTFSVAGNSDVPVNYKLRDDNGWAIYDIEVDSISLVTSYRSAFSKEIENGGVEGLIKTLKERNAK